jgi:hypothetical protein
MNPIGARVFERVAASGCRREQGEGAASRNPPLFVWVKSSQAQ